MPQSSYSDSRLLPMSSLSCSSGLWYSTSFSKPRQPPVLVQYIGVTLLALHGMGELPVVRENRLVSLHPPASCAILRLEIVRGWVSPVYIELRTSLLGVDDDKGTV